MMYDMIYFTATGLTPSGRRPGTLRYIGQNIRFDATKIPLERRYQGVFIFQRITADLIGLSCCSTEVLSKVTYIVVIQNKPTKCTIF
jgi:hypothetical protein